MDVTKEQKYFQFYKKLPAIFTGIIIVWYFIWGIIDPSVFQESYSYTTLYGVMRLESGFLCWFIWQLIGSVCAAITYFISKILISYKILHIAYQKEMRDTLNEIKKSLQHTVDDNDASKYTDD